MHYVVVGGGAIGLTVAACLASSGREVDLVTRGAAAAQINEQGIDLRGPEARRTARVRAHDSFSACKVSESTVVLLAVKTQDALVALQGIEAAFGTRVPVFCMQNGVETERLAGRIFEKVYGVMVMLPALLLGPGAVAAFSAPNTGVLHQGAFPKGVDTTAASVSEELQAASFVSDADPDIMRQKYTKLLFSLGNAAELITGQGRQNPVVAGLLGALKREGEEVLRKAGVEVCSDAEFVERVNSRVVVRPVPDAPSYENSTVQSVARGKRSLETDFFNGEIVLLGKQHGVATPLNTRVRALAAEVAAGKRSPGSVDPAALLEERLAPA